METPGKLKGTLFGGYKKANVNEYIMDSAQSFEKKRKELEEQRDELKERAARLEKENDELRERNRNAEEKVAVLERERTYIADALLNAKQEAEKIVSQAHLDAAAIRSGLEVELEDLRAELRAEKRRISELRNGAKSALEEYIARIEGIDMEEEQESDIEAEEKFESEGENKVDAEIAEETACTEEDDFEFGIEDIES